MVVSCLAGLKLRAARNAPSVVRFKSSRKLSVKACARFARSISNAINITTAQSIIFRSIFRISLFSSAHVHLAAGSNRWKFSLVLGQRHASDEIGSAPSATYQSDLGRYFSAVSGSSKTLGSVAIALGS